MELSHIYKEEVEPSSPPSWATGLVVGSSISTMIRASLAEAEPTIFEQTEPQLSCGLAEVLAGTLADGCSTLDLEGELRHGELFERYNTTVNATLHRLAEELSTGQARSITSLLLSSNQAALVDNGGLPVLALAMLAHGGVRQVCYFDDSSLSPPPSDLFPLLSVLTSLLAPPSYLKHRSSSI